MSLLVAVASCLLVTVALLIWDLQNQKRVDFAVERLLRKGAIVAQRLPPRVEGDQTIVRLGNEIASLRPNKKWTGVADSEILSELSPFTFDQMINSMPRLGQKTGVFRLYAWGDELRLEALRPRTPAQPLLAA